MNHSYPWGSPAFSSHNGTLAVWWNARAAFPAKHNRRKEEYLFKILQRRAITGLMECHGTLEQIQHRLRRHLHLFELLHFPALREDGTSNLAAGGILILIPLCMNVSSIQKQIFVQGSAIKVSLHTSSGTIVYYVVHCHKIPKQTLDHIAVELRKDIDKAKENPYEFIVLFGGDFNYMFPGEKKFLVNGENPPPEARQDTTSNSSHEVPCEFRQFHEAVQLLTEISDSRPTFYRHAHRAEYRLDRAFWSLPPQVSRFSYVSGGTIPK